MNDRRFGRGNSSKEQNSAYGLLDRAFLVGLCALHTTPSFYRRERKTYRRERKTPARIGRVRPGFRSGSRICNEMGASAMFLERGGDASGDEMEEARTMESTWLQLELICASKQAEELGMALMEMGSLGVEERALDGNPMMVSAARENPAAEVCLVAYFAAETSEKEQRQATELVVGWGIPVGQISWTSHEDDGWSTRWMEHFRPLEIGPRLVICPTWETFSPSPEQKVLRLDPGMAFGTGHHATTRSCLLLLEKYLPGASVLLDVGCGSGILSLAAILLGLPRAEGVDVDPDSIQIAYENAELNGLSEFVEFSTTPIERVGQAYPLVLANIQAHILNPMAPALRKRTEEGGHLILSGILLEQTDEVCEVFEKEGFVLLEKHPDEEWMTLAFRKG